MKTVFIYLTLCLVLIGNIQGKPALDTFSSKERLEVITVTIDEKNHSLQLECLFKFESPLMIDPSTIRVALQTKDTLYTNLIVRSLQQSQESDIKTIVVVPPLRESVFKGQSYTFQVQYITNEVQLNTQKTIQLGGFFQQYTIHPYSSTFGKILPPIVCMLICSMLCLSIRPMYQNYRFKKQYIHKYASIKKEGKEVLDPYTYEPLLDTDTVVTADEQLIKITSWKRLQQQSNLAHKTSRIKAWDMLWKTAFFKPKTTTQRCILSIWYACLGTTLGWIFGQAILALLIEYVAQSTITIWGSLGMAITIGWMVETLCVLSSQWHTQAQLNLKTTFRMGILRVTIMGVLFGGYCWISHKIGYVPYISTIVGWIVFSVGIATPTSLSAFSIHRLLIALLVGGVTIIVYELLSLPVWIANGGMPFVCYLSCVVISIGLTISNYFPVDKFLRLGQDKIKRITMISKLRIGAITKISTPQS